MRLPIAVLFLSLLAVPAWAATPSPAKTTPIETLDKKTEEMLKGLDENKATQFQKIRTAHGTIRAVNDVKNTLDRAVTSCGKNNPDIKTDITARFQEWKNAVMPVVRRGENRLEKMVLTQNFAPQASVRAYLKTFDEAVAYKNNAYQEVPVSDKDACTALMKNMDQTQKIMGGMITETLGLDQDIKPKE